MTVRKSAIAVTSGGVIACCVAFTPIWEGMDPVAKHDAIGTGHPITYCYGQTDEFGKVKVGQKFTKAECDEKLAESLPKYLSQIEPCVHVDLPDKTMASLLDASYNAGPAAVCRSPMVAKINAGDIQGGCNAFEGWYIRSAGVVRKGLIDRRDGEEHGDKRKSERALCLEGLSDTEKPVDAPAKPVATKSFCSGSGQGADCPRNAKPVIAKPKPKPAPKPPCPWWKFCG